MFSQPTITPPAKGIDLSNQTALVTGATSGIGLEISKQFLSYSLSTLIIAARNITKGEKVKSQLKTSYPRARIEVLKLDMERYDSITDFLKQLSNTVDELHIVMLNAGIVSYEFEHAPSGNEKSLQVNYLSNVLLTVGLLPILETTSRKTGRPSRLSWTGSNTHKSSALQNSTIPSDTPLFKYINTVDPSTRGRYANSKLCVAMFIHELSRQYPSDHVIINHFCPGMVATDLNNALPVYIRVPWNLLTRWKSRPVEVGGWIAVNAAVVVGAETHGKFIEGKQLEEPCEYMQSEQGRKTEKMVWNESMEEMEKYTTLPSWMRIL